MKLNVAMAVDPTQLLVGVLSSLDNELNLIYEAEEELKKKKLQIQEMMKSLETLS